MDEREKALRHAKVHDRESLAALLGGKPADFRLVFTNGCFDLLHPGHVDLLRRARGLGDALVVGVNSDDSVRRLSKGPGRPFQSLAERAYVLAHLASVDFVVPFDEDTPYALIALLQPLVLVKGGDWPVARIVGRDLVEAMGGAAHSLSLLPGYSTSALAERIRGGAALKSDEPR